MTAIIALTLLFAGAPEVDPELDPRFKAEESEKSESESESDPDLDDADVDAEPPAAPAPEAARDEERAPPRAAPLRIAVYDFERSGVDERLGRIVTDAVLTEVRKLQRVNVIGMDEVRIMLDHEAQKQMLGCEADDSCLADIAGALGVDVLVVGNLARIEDQHVFGLRRIDQNEANVAGSVTRRLKAEGGEEFLAVVGAAVAELFPDVPLREGQERGVSPELALRLSPPPLSPWAFWSGASVTAAAGVATLGLSTAMVLLWIDYQGDVARGQTEPIDGSGLQAKSLVVNVVSGSTLGALGVTAALAAGTGVTIPFVDWVGYGELDDE